MSVDDYPEGTLWPQLNIEMLRAMYEHDPVALGVIELYLVRVEAADRASVAYLAELGGLRTRNDLLQRRYDDAAREVAKLSDELRTAREEVSQLHAQEAAATSRDAAWEQASSRYKTLIEDMAIKSGGWKLGLDDPARWKEQWSTVNERRKDLPKPPEPDSS